MDFRAATRGARMMLRLDKYVTGRSTELRMFLLAYVQYIVFEAFVR